MNIITAPDIYICNSLETSVFLAGGIRNTENWQDIVIDSLAKEFHSAPLVVYNPRRVNYPIHDTNATFEQIKWEFDRINESDIFSMYFASGNTDQPICMFEYSKQLIIRAQNTDLRRLIVSANPDYSRYQDVVIQTSLAVGSYLPIFTSLESHITHLINAIRYELSLK